MTAVPCGCWTRAWWTWSSMCHANMTSRAGRMVMRSAAGRWKAECRCSWICNSRARSSKHCGKGKAVLTSCVPGTNISAVHPAACKIDVLRRTVSNRHATAYTSHPRPLSMSEKVLDIGCGPNKASKDYFGVDINGGPGVDVICDFERPLPFLTDSVDMIVTRHTLEHVQNLEQILREFSRIVKPGGRLSITVPHFSNTLGF